MKTLRSLFHIFFLIIGVLALLPFAGIPFTPLPKHGAGAKSRKTARRRGAENAVDLRHRRAWFATPMVREAFRNLTNLEAALSAIFFKQMTSVTDPNQEILQFFRKGNSSRAVERNQGVGGFGDIPEYSGTLEYDSFELLYQKSYEHIQYARGVAVERQLIDDDEYGVIRQRVERLGLAFDRTRYKHAASVFNNAFSATTAAMQGGDGKALCATDHPLSPTDASTQSNKGTTALSFDAVTTTETAMMGFTDAEGNNLGVMPDTILVPVALSATARTIAGSAAKPGTANNDANIHDGYRVVVSRYLTDANNWFLVDSRMALMFLNWYDRVKPEYKADPASDFNLVAKFRGYMRYSFGFDHWAWVYGHEVA
jgi:hypothetical protein